MVDGIGGGGVYAQVTSETRYPIGSGGGATDICTVYSNVTKDSYYRYVRTAASYNSRIIVAGGGGGCGLNQSPIGGYGGGTEGGSGSGENNPETGVGGTQSKVGTSNKSYEIGGFGLGATGIITRSNCDASSGGGGGYYGGGAIWGANCCSAGGGSGYVNTSKLTSASTKAGNQSFPSPTSSGNETGHSGNGYSRITPVN